MGREKREERREKREREKREERERERERDIVHALQYLVPQLVRQPSSFLFLLGLLGDNINILVLILIVVVVFFSSRLLRFFEALALVLATSPATARVFGASRCFSE